MAINPARVCVGYSSYVTSHDTHLFANAGAANTEGPNKALPIATEPLRYFMSEPGAAEYIRLPMPGINKHTVNTQLGAITGGSTTIIYTPKVVL